MKILITGANGYIGKRLIPLLVQEGHEVYASVREPQRLALHESIKSRIKIVKLDFLKPGETQLPSDIDAAYYLIHSMTATKSGFQTLEETSAKNFVALADAAGIKQIIYLTGLIGDHELSEHLASRLAVENILKTARAKHTILRAGIIVGSGSASFEIIRDLVEKLPVMIAPKWLNTRCQPIAIRTVLFYLTSVLNHPKCQNQTFDIGGPDVLTYKQMLLQFAEVRNLRRWIGIVPVMTPKLSSYWLYFVTSTSYNLATNLVKSMKIDVVCGENNLDKVIHAKPITYKEAVEMAFIKIEQNAILSSWKDAFNYRGTFDPQEFLQVPEFGVFRDFKEMPLPQGRIKQVVDNVFSIGGERGWYYGNWLWRIRGAFDKAVGGIGLRRGRTNPLEIYPGDALDFWRVIAADRLRGRLLLFAEMKLPGEAWLEFQLVQKDDQWWLQQTATFRPSGLAGRLYWYSVLPFHYFVFGGMIRGIVNT